MNNNHSYYLYRIRLEKIKQRAWLLRVIAKLLFLLAVLIGRYG